MRYSRRIGRFVAPASALGLIACASSSSSSSSSTSASTTTTVPAPVSLVPTAAGTYAGPAVALSAQQGSNSLTVSSIGNANSDILTLVAPTAGTPWQSATLSSTALGGGGPIAITSQGASTQSGVTTQNYQGTFTYNNATYTFNLMDAGATANLNYSTFGQWNVTTGSTINSIGFYSAGSPTPSANVPTTGLATYTGGATGVATLNASSTGYPFTGIATLNAVFSSETITGAITNITAYSIAQPNTVSGSLNDIELTAGTISGNGFSGTAATSSTAGTATNTSGATGSFRGNFFGPAAQEAGGTFSLTNTSPNISISGSFGTHK